MEHLLWCFLAHKNLIKSTYFPCTVHDSYFVGWITSPMVMLHVLYSSQFLLHCPTPTTPHTHTHTHSTESGRVECLLPGASETGQADHDTLHTAEAQVTSTDSAPGQGVQYGALSADGNSVDVVQGRGGEVTQGQSGPAW